LSGIMKLSAWMTQEGLDDQELGRRVGKDRSTIYRIRTGTHKPSPDLMEAIAKATGGQVLPNDYFDDLPLVA
jgi:transcriptional regulator with XRE-family HTH domain